MRRDRYGEPVDNPGDDLELVVWEGHVAHHMRVAREGLPARERAPETGSGRREGLKSRLAARQPRWVRR